MCKRQEEEEREEERQDKGKGVVAQKQTMKEGYKEVDKETKGVRDNG